MGDFQQKQGHLEEAEGSPQSWAHSKLFTPIDVGSSNLSHRIVLAPLTRYRATAAHVPTALQASYYAQRASVPGTLLITEATFISPQASGYDFVPGVWSDEQVEGWRAVTEAVHARGSSVFLQLWAIGRAARPDVIASTDQVKTPGGPYDLVSASDIPLSTRPTSDPTPRTLTTTEIHEYIAQYVQAAQNAVAAGCDGVELHGAHGYLIDQFTQTNSNKRDDEWGGGVEGRCKFALAVVDAVVAAVGAKRTGIRLSPWSTFQDMRMSDEDVTDTFSYLVRTIRDKHPDFAFIHVPEPRVAGNLDRDVLKGESNEFLKDIWLKADGKPHKRVYIAAGGFTAETAVRDAEARDGVLVAFGRYFIPNPDLPARIAKQIPFAPYDRNTFYVPESPSGYTDFPFADKEAEENFRRAL